MPLYMSKDRSTGAVRHFEAPNNRAVLLHLAAEMFAVERVKFETIAEAPATTRGDGESPTADEVRGILTDAAAGQPPAPRRGRRPKNPPPEPAAERPAGEPGAEAAEQPNPSEPPQRASEGLLAAEALRVQGGVKSLYERMSDIARDNSPAPPLPPGDAEEGAAAGLGIAAAPEDEDEGAPTPTRPEPMFEE